MIKSSRRLMMSLKKLASFDTDEIWIDYENEKFTKVRVTSSPKSFIPFPKNEPSINGLLENLSDEGFIEFDNNDKEYFTLTYKSLYYSQIIHKERIDYFLKSVFVPIILSFVTTLITNLLTPNLLLMLLEYLQELV